MAALLVDDGAVTDRVDGPGRAASQFVTFVCADRALGLDIMSVREIRSWSPTTLLPDQAPAARGVLDIRGSIVPVYDLAMMLGVEAGGGGVRSGQVVLVVSLASHDIGIVVDSVSDIIFSGPEDLRPVPTDQRGSQQASKVSGLVRNEDRLIAILDLGALFPAVVADRVAGSSVN